MGSGPAEIPIYISISLSLFFCVGRGLCVEMSFRQRFIRKQNETEEAKSEMSFIIIRYFLNAIDNFMPHRVRFL